MERGLKEGKTYYGELFKEKRIPMRFFYSWWEKKGMLVCGGWWAVRDEQNRNSKRTQNTCGFFFCLFCFVFF